MASTFLFNIEMSTEQIVKFMLFSFKVANELSAKISGTERRYLYTIPKSFLLLIMLFQGNAGQDDE
jgi:hypothetical protein